MDNIGYTTLSRQSGLLKELEVVANNIANASTTGFRREDVTFAEFIDRLGKGDDSLSMTAALVRRIDSSQGTLNPTGGPFDLAIQGEGYFLIGTPQGPMLTRAGDFTTNESGELVTPEGHHLLDLGGAPIFVPPDAGDFAIGTDGTVQANGLPLAQIGLVAPDDPTDLQRRGNGLFESPGGFSPVADAVILQGFTEAANVNPIAEISRLIEVQRSYEQGQKFMDQEDERIRNVIQTIGR
ncbi:flagellar hook-basal body complex protein [Frigidibacter sp. ROC022]|uniref:flagellar hook-basal body complex protein n=1 Tax=Frigidibacter sp. ROC022 TaxID=2971796 RepID=UPI00215A469F|nr:flagellar hook-basal body complex protein [Frigidibacter sp. ROC022]MCR8724367.1 flagellar hook-basal body complex protein [Frigidibacter sp. ROC022]